MEPSTLIKSARKAAGLTQAELAKRARMKQPEIARLESAGANPLIAESLRQTPDERLRGFESMYRFATEFGGKLFRANGP